MGFLQQMVYPFASGFGVQGIIWTMTIAASFYLVFPFIVRGFQRQPLIGLAVAIAISVTWRLATRGDPHTFLQFPLFAIDFGMGMAAAVAYVRLQREGRPRLSPRVALGCFSVAFVALIAGLYASGHDIVETRAYWNEGVLLSILVPASFAALLVCLPFTPAWVQWPLANRLARFIGSINYGLFLSHFLVIWGVLYLTDIPRNSSPLSVVKLTLLVMPLSVLFGWLGTKFVEHPIRTRAYKLAARQRASKSPEPAGAPAAAPAPATAPAPD
jgi:peptidoglycan/LPS O-acetylase OafA/YrhL